MQQVMAARNQVSPRMTRTIDGNQKDFQEVTLKDKTAAAVVGVWEEMVGKLERGDIVTITKCRVRLFNEEKRLTTTFASECEKVSHDEEMEDVSSEDDSDQGDVSDSSRHPEGTLTALFEVDPYLACPLPSCRNTKLITLKKDKYVMHCRKCNNDCQTASANIYARATVMLSAGNNESKVTIFTPVIKKLLQSRGLEDSINFDREGMFKRLFEVIPINIRYNIVNQTLVDVVCKRDAQ